MFILAVICVDSISGINAVPILVTEKQESINKTIAKTKTIGLNLKHSLNNFSYPFINLSNKLCCFWSILDNKLDDIHGTKVRATNKLAISE